MDKKKYSYVGISFIILVFGIFVARELPHRLSKLEVIGDAPEFSFTDQHGNTITQEDYKGMVYLVEFFFTTCPDICRIMNDNMVKIQNEFLGNPKVGIASFTIDPNRDTPEVLKEYAANNGISKPQWHLLTGEKEDIFKLANEGFKLYVGRSQSPEASFEHSGLFALIDKEGKIRSRKDEHGNPIIYYNGLDAKDIQMLKEDIKKLL